MLTLKNYVSMQLLEVISIARRKEKNSPKDAIKENGKIVRTEQCMVVVVVCHNS